MPLAGKLTLARDFDPHPKPVETNQQKGIATDNALAFYFCFMLLFSLTNQPSLPILIDFNGVEMMVFPIAVKPDQNQDRSKNRNGQNK